MFFLRSKLLAVFATLGVSLVAVSSAHATPLFFDSFQGTLSQWQTVGSAVIVDDPLVAGGKALAFTALGSGGDLFSFPITGTGPGRFNLSFDVLEHCNAATLCGGFVGIDQAPGGEHWLASDTPFGDAVQFAATGVWQHVSFNFTSTGQFDLKLEDFAGSQNAYPYTGEGGASVYFKNLGVSAVPEPTTFSLMGIGLAGVAMLRRRMA